MLIEREELCSLIPHGGSMCLLEQVIEWDDKHIICQTHTHLSADNPLRSRDGLAAVNAIEYGAQAMAVHGGLLARQTGKKILQGYLVAARNIKINIEWLDSIASSLMVEAEKIMHDDRHSIYEFRILADDILLVSGRTTVMAQTQAEI